MVRLPISPEHEAKLGRIAWNNTAVQATILPLQTRRGTCNIYSVGNSPIHLDDVGKRGIIQHYRSVVNLMVHGNT